MHGDRRRQLERRDEMVEPAEGLGPRLDATGKIARGNGLLFPGKRRIG